jgi:hypothetical protein
MSGGSAGALSTVDTKLAVQLNPELTDASVRWTATRCAASSSTRRASMAQTGASAIWRSQIDG